MACARAWSAPGGFYPLFLLSYYQALADEPEGTGHFVIFRESPHSRLPSATHVIAGWNSFSYRARTVRCVSALPLDIRRCVDRSPASGLGLGRGGSTISPCAANTR